MAKSIINEIPPFHWYDILYSLPHRPACIAFLCSPKEQGKAIHAGPCLIYGKKPLKEILSTPLNKYTNLTR